MKTPKMLMALAVASILALASVTPAYANTYTNGATSGSIAVTAVVGSTYQITLPATLELAYVADQTGYNYAADYAVGVKANLTDSEYITVTPSGTFTMTAADSSATATATATQAVNKWVNTASAANEIAADRTAFSNTTGRITVQLDQAGSYSGNLSFTFAKGSN